MRSQRFEFAGCGNEWQICNAAISRRRAFRTRQRIEACTHSGATESQFAHVRQRGFDMLPRGRAVTRTENSCPSVNGVASCKCVRPILTMSANAAALPDNVVRRRARNEVARYLSAAATCIAVGNTSFEDWPRLTSFGCTSRPPRGPPSTRGAIGKDFVDVHVGLVPIRSARSRVGIAGEPAGDSFVGGSDNRFGGTRSTPSCVDASGPLDDQQRDQCFRHFLGGNPKMLVALVCAPRADRGLDGPKSRRCGF